MQSLCRKSSRRRVAPFARAGASPRSSMSATAESVMQPSETSAAPSISDVAGMAGSRCSNDITNGRPSSRPTISAVVPPQRTERVPGFSTWRAYSASRARSKGGPVKTWRTRVSRECSTQQVMSSPAMPLSCWSAHCTSRWARSPEARSGSATSSRHTCRSSCSEPHPNGNRRVPRPDCVIPSEQNTMRSWSRASNVACASVRPFQRGSVKGFRGTGSDSPSRRCSAGGLPYSISLTVPSACASSMVKVEYEMCRSGRAAVRPMIISAARRISTSAVMYSKAIVPVSAAATLACRPLPRPSASTAHTREPSAERRDTNTSPLQVLPNFRRLQVSMSRNGMAYSSRPQGSGASAAKSSMTELRISSDCAEFWPRR